MCKIVCLFVTYTNPEDMQPTRVKKGLQMIAHVHSML